MKLLLNIYKYTFKQLIGNPVILISIGLVIIVSLSLGILSDKSDRKDIYRVGVVNLDEGEYSGKFMDSLEKIETVEILETNREKARKMVSFGSLDGAVIIGSDFSSSIILGKYNKTLELMVPKSTTAIYPLSESMAIIVLELWLEIMVDEILAAKFKEADDNTYDSYHDFKAKVESESGNEDIIELEYIGDEDWGNEITADPLQPLKSATDIYGKFILFIIILSNNWVFSLKHKSLADRFRSVNISFADQYISSLAATVTIFFIGYVLLGVLCSMFIRLPEFGESIKFLAGMLLYLISISSIAMVVASLVTDMVQLIISGAAIAVVNMAIVSTGNSTGIASYSSIASILPGTHIFDFFENKASWYAPFVLALTWVAVSLVIIYLRQLAAKFYNRIKVHIAR